MPEEKAAQPENVCPVCQGRGVVAYEAPPAGTTDEAEDEEPEITCPSCGGSGRVPIEE